jgi:iron complex transport system ATP-binding protein
MLELSIKSFSYDGSFNLSDIRLSFDGPGLVALVGPNGSGKSTLLKIAGGLLRGAGIDVSAGGGSLSRTSPLGIARVIAWVPQRADSVFTMSLREMVRVGRYRLHRPLRESSDGEDRAIELAIADVGLEHFAERDVETLSGGEWQRALIARAIAQDTPILLLDEPVASLDLRYQDQVYRLLSSLAGRGRLVLVADHHLELAASHAERIIVLKAGRVVADGVPGSVLTSERIAEVFGVRIRVFPDPVTGTPRLSRPEGDS